MESISTHTAALLALLKRFFLQNAQPSSTTYMKGWRLRGFFLKLILIAIIINKNLTYSQVSSYSFATASTTYSSITGGTAVIYPTCYDEYTSSNISLGFTFTYNGNNYTQAAFNSNGYVFLGSTANTYSPISSESGSNIISGFGCDLIAINVSNASEIRYETIGESPNKTFVVQWKQYRRYGYSDVLNFQIRLSETTNIIEVRYGSCSTTNNVDGSTMPQIGLKGASNTDYNNRFMNNTGSDWSSATSTGIVNNATVRFRNVSAPSSGTIFRWSLCSATTYYSKSTGNLDLTSSWSSTADGTGCSPANFTTAGVTYIIQQNLAGNATRTIGANWTVSGAGSKVVLGQASAAAVTFTVPNNFSFTGTIDVAAASSGSNTLVLKNTTVPTLGTLNNGSTVKFNASGAQTIQATTYGNLETGVESGTSNSTKTAAGALDINGNLTMGDYSTLALSSYSHTLAGDFIKPTGNGILSAGTSTLTFDGSSTQKIHVTAAGGTTPCDADITYNNLVINGSDVKLYYNQVTNRKMNILDLTVNASKVLTLFSAP